MGVGTLVALGVGGAALSVMAVLAVSPKALAVVLSLGAKRPAVYALPTASAVPRARMRLR